MKHTITMVHEVEAEAWSDALEEVLLRAPIEHLTACHVKTPGMRLQRVMPSTIKAAVKIASQVERKS